MVVALLVVAAVAIALGLRHAGPPALRERPRLPRHVRVLGVVPAPAPVLRALRRMRPGVDAAGLVAAAGIDDAHAITTFERARVWGSMPLIALAGLGAGTVGCAVAIAPAVAASVVGVEASLRRQVRRRRAEIVDSLPDVLDLLAVAVESGVALDAAVEHAATGRGALAEEIRRLRADVALGEPWAVARAGLAARCDCVEVDQLLAALTRADELGSPPAEILGELADSMRAARRDAAREAAARAAPKIQLVVALVMVPGAVVLVLGVLTLELVRQVGGVLA